MLWALKTTIKSSYCTEMASETTSHLSMGKCTGPAAHLTMQSCMILFQSSPVTIRKRTVIALPAVEKLACLRLKEIDTLTQLCKELLYCTRCLHPVLIIEKNSINNNNNKIPLLVPFIIKIGKAMITGLCSLRIWRFRREQLQQMHSREEGETSPRWWRSSCTCWRLQWAAASLVSPLRLYTKVKKQNFIPTPENLFG